MGRIFRFAKRCIPNSIKSAIKRTMGIPEHVRLGEENVFPQEPLSQCQSSAPGESDSVVNRCGGKFRIAMLLGGGMGDYIVFLNIIDQILTLCDCIVHIFPNDSLVYSGILYRDRPNVKVYTFDLFEFAESQYDIVLEISHYTMIRRTNYAEIEKHAPELYAVFALVQKFNKSHFAHLAHNASPVFALRQSKFMGFNRWTYLGANGAFRMEDQRSSVFVDRRGYDAIRRHDLHDVEYVVINRGADPMNGGHHQTKVWPAHNYEELLRIFKEHKPNVQVVQLAANKEPRIMGIDRLLRNIALEDVFAILKNALIFVGSEGGLAHLASQMSTPCVIVFGPTPAYYYGYERNKNIESSFCSDCMGANASWYTICPKGFSTARCMEEISGEAVADMLLQLMGKRKRYSYEVDALKCYRPGDMKKYASSVSSIIRKNSMKVNEDNENAVGPAGTFLSVKDRWKYSYLLEQLESEGKRLNVAVVGVGRGVLPFHLAKLGHNVTSYDAAFPSVGDGDNVGYSQFMQFCKKKRIDAKLATGFNLPKESDAFDVVIAVSVMKNPVHAEYLLSELLRVVRPGGMLVMTLSICAEDDAARIEECDESLSVAEVNKLLNRISTSVQTYAIKDVEAGVSAMRLDEVGANSDDTLAGLLIRKRQILGLKHE